MKRTLPWLLLGTMFIGILLINLFSIPAHDELSYAFAGQHTPMTGECARISSLWDIIVQQYGDYQIANGRVFVHGVVAFFAGFKLYTLFDVVNTIMWFVFSWLLLHEGGVRIRSMKTYFFGSAIVWWALWYAETCSINAAFAVNYLWTATATIGMMMLWRHLTHWWLVPIAFFYGWSQESFVLPMLAGLLVGTLLRSIFEHRIAITTKQVVAWFLMLIGACFLCFGPAALRRATETTAMTPMEYVFEIAKANIGLVLCVTPAIVLLLLLWIVWHNRKSIPLLIKRSPEWWCFLFAAYGLFCITSSAGVIRLSMATLLAALILVLRERNCFTLRPWIKTAFLCLMMTWFIGAVIVQAQSGRANLQMVKHYRQNSQGITFYEAITTGPFHYSTAMGVYNRWHRMIFQREFEKSSPPIILSPWLYDNLYKAPEKFFADAQELNSTGLYVTKHSSKAVIMRGNAPLTSEQIKILKAYYANATTSPAGWRRFIPGRLKAMFPVEDYHLAAPTDATTFTAKDGNIYTLLLPAEKEGAVPAWAR